jgi:hypothetical protein
MNRPVGPGAEAGAPVLHVPDSVERDELAGFVARVVQLDATSVVRLRAAEQRVVAWASTPFEVLATRAVTGQLFPVDLTVPASELLAALAVVRHAEVDPGSRADARWRAELPPAHGWLVVGELPAGELAALADEGLARAREHGGTHGHGGEAPLPSGELMDQTSCTAEGNGARVDVPLRCLFTLSGLGLLAGGGGADRIAVSTTEDGGWVRLDTPGAAVVRRRRALLPLVF